MNNLTFDHYEKHFLLSLLKQSGHLDFDKKRADTLADNALPDVVESDIQFLKDIVNKLSI